MSEKISEWLKENGLHIGHEALVGDEKAQAIVHAYSMWQRCPGDNMAAGLVQVRIDEYLEAQSE